MLPVSHVNSVLVAKLYLPVLREISISNMSHGIPSAGYLACNTSNITLNTKT